MPDWPPVPSMPDPATTPQQIFCEGCHQVRLKYGAPQTSAALAEAQTGVQKQEAALHFK